VCCGEGKLLKKQREVKDEGSVTSNLNGCVPMLHKVDGLVKSDNNVVGRSVMFSWMAFYSLHPSCFMGTVYWGGVCAYGDTVVNGEGVFSVLDTH
jgi:hypothetical protein